MLDSLLKQDLCKEEYEIIVVDDGSKEEPVILKKYVQQYPIIKYVRQENAGPGSARNTGVVVSKGEYIFFCDSDDYIVNDVLGGLYNIAHDRALDMLFHNVNKVQEKDVNINLIGTFGNIVEYDTGKFFLAAPFMGRIHTGPCQYIISRDFINRAQLSFPENWIMNEDSSFLIDAVLAAGRTGKVDVDAYFYVQNPQSLIHQAGRVRQAEKWADNMLSFIRKLTGILNNECIIKDMPKGCIDNIKWVRNQKAFIMLVGACHNLSVASFNNKVDELRQLGAYPKPFGRYLFLKYLFLRPSILGFLNKRYASKNKINSI